MRRAVVAASLIVAAVAIARFGAPTTRRVDPNAPVAESGRVLDSATGGAFNGTHALFAWSDYRETFDSTQADIYAVRVPQGSAITSERAFRVNAAAGLQSEVAVAQAGSNGWLVTWTDRRSGDFDVYAARVTPDAAVLDQVGLPIAATSMVESVPAAAFDGTRYWVVFQSGPDGGSTDVQAMTVQLDGSVAGPFTVTTSPGNQSEPAIGCGTGQCLIAWSDDSSGTRDVRATFINGTSINPASFAVSADVGSQDLAAIGVGANEYVVAWVDDRLARQDVMAARVNTTGSVLDAMGRAVTSTAATRRNVSVDCYGTHCAIVWAQTASGWDVFASTFDLLANSIAGPAQLTSNTRIQRSPAVVRQSALADGYVTAFFDNTFAGNDNTRAIRFSTSRVIAESSFVSTNDPHQYASNVIAANDLLHAAWLERRDGFFKARAGVFDSSFTQVIPAFDLGGAGAAGVAGHDAVPMLASSGASTLVMWAERAPPGFQSVLFRSIINGSGRAIDAGIVSDPNFDAVGQTAEWLGSDYLAMWGDARAGDLDIVAARISSTGVIGGINPVRGGARDQRNPELACRGNRCVVLFANSLVDAGFALHSLLIDPATLITVSETVLDDSVDYEWFEVVASDAGYFAAWTKNQAGGPTIRASRLNDLGVPLDLQVLSSPRSYDPTIVSNPPYYDVVWLRDTTGFRSVVNGASVLNTGVIAQPETTILPESTYAIEGPKLTTLNGAGILTHTDYKLPGVFGWQALLTRFTLLDAGPPSDAGVDAGVVDAGIDAGAAVDAGFDAGVVVDAGIDAGVIVDAGIDAGVVVDAGIDAGVVLVDAGIDAGVVVDAGIDAGEVDAGIVDAGEVDAGLADAGTDGGLIDAGQDSGVDAGSFDAGVDAGTEPSETQRFSVGCGCFSTDASWLLALALLATTRRRTSLR